MYLDVRNAFFAMTKTRRDAGENETACGTQRARPLGSRAEGTPLLDTQLTEPRRRILSPFFISPHVPPYLALAPTRPRENAL